MKLTVVFGPVSLVVPCGTGDFPVSEIISRAVDRYVKATGQEIKVAHLLSCDGAMLLPDDLVCDVTDDREMITAVVEEERPYTVEGRAFKPYIRNQGEVSNGEVTVTSEDHTGLRVRRGSEPVLNMQDENFLRSINRRSLINPDIIFNWMERTKEKRKDPVGEEHTNEPDGTTVSIPFSASPLGIHIVPHEAGLLVQGVEPGGRVEGQLLLGDIVTQINGRIINNMTFTQQQQVFREALTSNPLVLKVTRSLTGQTGEVTLTVSLVKGPQGLGISLTSRDNPVGSRSQVYIKNVNLTHCQLKSGDCVLAVNRRSTEGQSYKEVVQYLRNTKVGENVTLEVSRKIKPTEPLEPEDLPVVEELEPVPQWQPPKDVIRVTLPVLRSGLGVSVKGKTSPEGCDLGIFIKDILPDGSAAKSDLLRINDRLLEVNGHDLEVNSNVKAMEILRDALKDARDEVSLNVLREAIVEEEEPEEVEEDVVPFNRDDVNRQSINEKRKHRIKDSTDIYDEAPVEIKRSNSLEKIKQPNAQEKKKSDKSVSRARGINESFRAAVDKSYDDRGSDSQNSDSFSSHDSKKRIRGFKGFLSRFGRRKDDKLKDDKLKDETKETNRTRTSSYTPASTYIMNSTRKPSEIIYSSKHSPTEFTNAGTEESTYLYRQPRDILYSYQYEPSELVQYPSQVQLLPPPYHQIPPRKLKHPNVRSLADGSNYMNLEDIHRHS